MEKTDSLEITADDTNPDVKGDCEAFVGEATEKNEIEEPETGDNKDNTQETIVNDSSPAKKQRKRQVPADVVPSRRSRRLNEKREAEIAAAQHMNEITSDDEVTINSTETSFASSIVESTADNDDAKTGAHVGTLPSPSKKRRGRPPKAAKKAQDSVTVSSPRRLVGMPPFSSGPVSSSVSSLPSVDKSEEVPEKIPSSTDSKLRRSRRQPAAVKKTKYPEGEWVSPLSGRGVKRGKDKDEDSNSGQSSPKKHGVILDDNDTCQSEATTEEKGADENTGKLEENEEERAPEIKPLDIPSNEQSSAEDDDVPLAQIALDKKVEEMFEYPEPLVRVSKDDGDHVAAVAAPDQEAVVEEEPNDGTKTKEPNDGTTEKEAPTNHAAEPAGVSESPLRDTTLFCVGSDGDSDSSSDNDIGRNKGEDTATLKGKVSTSKQLPSPVDDDTQYPCTVCRRPSFVGQLIRCQNCPRYFHKDCIPKSGDVQDPAKRRFCPKCEHSGPALPSSLLSKPRRKKRKLDDVSSSMVVKYRRESKSSLFDVGDLAKTCPGCGRKSLDVKRKRDSGEEYSIYCNIDCVMKTVRKTLRALKGNEDERVLVMDTVVGNVMEKRRSPFLRNFSAWLRKHLTCYPVLPTTPADTGTCTASSRTETSRLETLEQNAPDTEGEEEMKKDVFESGKFKTIDHPAAIDPSRLGVRKALRDVLLLRAKDADDVLLTSDEIKQLAVDLEQDIHRVQKEESYKHHCRNLIANLRNPSNKGLFRRLLNGELSTKRAAMLTSTELRSTEYSYWAAAADEQDRTEEAERLKTAYMESSKLFCRTKVVTEADSTCDIFGLLHSDTTSEHKSHLFDLNCKICTGKQKEEDAPAPLARRDRKDTASSSRSSVTLSYRPELGEKLIKRDDGKMDIVYAVPSSRRSDPLHLESSGMTSVDDAEDGAKASPNLAVQAPLTEASSYSSEDSISHQGSITPAGHIESTTLRGSSTDPTTPVTPTEDKGTRPLPPASNIPSFWHGMLDMPQWFRFQTSFKPVSGPVHLLKRDLPSRLEVVGRISPKVVYDYLSQIKKTGGKDIIVFRLPEPPFDDDRQQWLGMFSNMMERQRFCVVDNKPLPMIKDFYILPLASNEEPNEALMPLDDGPGLEIPRKDTVLGLVVRHRERQGPESSKKHSVDSPMSRKESKRESPDYMKIIKFHSSTPMSTGHTESPQPSSKNDDPVPSTSDEPKKGLPIPQSTLKVLLDEIGQAQSPTDLASKIVNCLKQTTTASSSPFTTSFSSPNARMETSSALDGRPNMDPRQRMTPIATSTPPTTSKGDGKDPEEKDEENVKEWMNWVQSVIKSRLPHGQTTQSATGEQKTSVDVPRSSGNVVDGPGSSDNVVDSVTKPSGWQPMALQSRPPVPPVMTSVPPPDFTVPPPFIHGRLPFPVPSTTALTAPHLQIPPPGPCPIPPRQSPIPQGPSQLPPRPSPIQPGLNLIPPGPSPLPPRPNPIPPGPSQIPPPYFPGFAPPPVPPPSHPYSVPPPYLLAPPPPPPPPPPTAQQHAMDRSNPLEEGEVNSSDEETPGSGDKSRRRDSHRKREHRRDKRESPSRHSWNRWDRPQTSSGDWRQSDNLPSHSGSGRGSESSSGSTYCPVDNDRQRGGTSSGSGGVILKQGFYGPRQPRRSGGNRFNMGDQHRRIWK